ncbi:MAG: hypothetical protein HYZ24_16210 [Chloroflexi bacterium]|nr:hypothetical protein [Chloroflexota bacterium]
MTEPLRTRYAPGYDLFKLIVAIILTVVLIWLLLQENKRKYEQAQASPTLANTPTLQATAQTLLPDSTGTSAAFTPTPAAAPAESPTPAAPSVTPGPKASPAPDLNACPSNPTRIQVGDTVKVLDWLNFRIGPGLNYPIQRANRPGIEMEVIGGPVCTVKEEDPPRAYLWWNVRAEGGEEGWSAEAPLNFPNYFMEPVK